MAKNLDVDTMSRLMIRAYNHATFKNALLQSLDWCNWYHCNNIHKNSDIEVDENGQLVNKYRLVKASEKVGNPHENHWRERYRYVTLKKVTQKEKNNSKFPILVTDPAANPKNAGYYNNTVVPNSDNSFNTIDITKISTARKRRKFFINNDGINPQAEGWTNAGTFNVVKVQNPIGNPKYQNYYECYKRNDQNSSLETITFTPFYGDGVGSHIYHDESYDSRICEYVNGTYVKTTDTEFISGKTYYLETPQILYAYRSMLGSGILPELTPGYDRQQINIPIQNPKAIGLYVYDSDEGEYVLTEDTTPNGNTRYYIRGSLAIRYQHIYYTPSNDTTVQIGKEYYEFVRSNDTVYVEHDYLSRYLDFKTCFEAFGSKTSDTTRVQEHMPYYTYIGGNPHAMGWYEVCTNEEKKKYTNTDCRITDDTEIVSGKDYYKMVYDTSEDPDSGYKIRDIKLEKIKDYSVFHYYVKITNPSGNPKERGWYEKSASSEFYYLTTDKTVKESKTYYRDDGANPNRERWFEKLVDNTVIISNDTSLNPDKQYYRVTTSKNDYIYAYFKTNDTVIGLDKLYYIYKGSTTHKEPLPDYSGHYVCNVDLQKIPGLEEEVTLDDGLPPVVGGQNG